jgi:hypothetical protein
VVTEPKQALCFLCALETSKDLNHRDYEFNLTILNGSSVSRRSAY